MRIARELDRTCQILERELLHTLPGRHIEDPYVLSRILVRRDAAAMHDCVQAGCVGVHGELLQPAGTPARLALRLGRQPPGRPRPPHRCESTSSGYMCPSKETKYHVAPIRTAFSVTGSSPMLSSGSVRFWCAAPLLVEGHEQQRSRRRTLKRTSAARWDKQRASGAFDFAHELARLRVHHLIALRWIEIVDQQETFVVRQHLLPIIGRLDERFGGIAISPIGLSVRNRTGSRRPCACRAFHARNRFPANR